VDDDVCLYGERDSLVNVDHVTGAIKQQVATDLLIRVTISPTNRFIYHVEIDINVHNNDAESCERHWWFLVCRRSQWRSVSGSLILGFERTLLFMSPIGTTAQIYQGFY